MLPVVPQLNTKLKELSRQIQERGNIFSGTFRPEVFAAIKHYLLLLNSFYTNGMEGNPSRLKDIEEALKKNFSSDKRLRNAQKEHLAHIHVENKMTARLDEESNLSVCSVEFLCWIHNEFYSQLPEEMRFTLTESGKAVPLVPGGIRDRGVSVGRHEQAPISKVEVVNALKEFEALLDPTRIEESKKVLAWASSHHRLLWIHPFADGNGRVARLFSRAYKYKLGIDRDGFWSVNRAFARNRMEYDRHLAVADNPREGDLDGRGNLSERCLRIFCEYFLEAALDQMDYMNSILQLEAFESRYSVFLDGEIKMKKLSKKERKVLDYLILKGKLPRGEVQKIAGVKARQATNIIRDLLVNDYATSNPQADHRGELFFHLNSRAVKAMFPDL